MIKVLELFGGIGAFREALNNIKVDYDVVDYVEIDKRAVRSYNAMFGENYEPTSVVGYQCPHEVDLLVHGSPCFRTGTLITTKQGYKDIKDVAVGDEVYSHDGTINKVIEKFESRNKKMADIVAPAIHILKTTDKHPFYIKRNNDYEWLGVSDLILGDYLTVPINKQSNEPNWKGVLHNHNNNIKMVNELPIKDLRFWELVGLFIGDGWVSRRKERNNNFHRTIICCSKNEIQELEDLVGSLFHYTKVEERTVFKLQISSKELATFLEQFGIGAENKMIPQWVLDLNTKYLRELLKGIMTSDGCFTQNYFKLGSVSEKLVYGLGQLVLKVHGVPYSIYKTKRPKQTAIEGRVVNQRDTYEIKYRLDGKHLKTMHFVEDGYLHSRISEIKFYDEMNTVYNMEVENTHSYQSCNIGTHNCQDFSMAGERQGGIDGTRSSLMFETVRIISEMTAKPKVVIWENVKGVLSKDMKPFFDKYVAHLDLLGYTTTYKVLNSRDFGVPQNRDRIFAISILGGEFDYSQLQTVPMRDIDDYLLDITLPSKYDVSSPSMLKSFENGRLKIIGDYAWTITTKQNRSPNAGLVPIKNGYRLLTERECWRLQGFSDDSFDKAELVNPSKEKYQNTNLYMQAGNSITVQVCEALIKEIINQGFL